MSAAVPYRPLGEIKELLEAHGLNLTHVYEDLIFMEHNAFLLQMGAKGEDVALVFNVDCDPDNKANITNTLIESGKNYGLKIFVKGTYTITQNEDETLDIAFSDPE